MKLLGMIISLLISLFFVFGFLLYLIEAAVPIFGIKLENKIRNKFNKEPVSLGAGEYIGLFDRPSQGIINAIRKRAGLLFILFLFLMTLFNAITEQMGIFN